tara:strand:+ start:1210 stop:2001 length:792 start_codon:yes stop_codon:yes gene_type:complete
MGKNKVDLFFCGDSFTWGEELQGPEQNHHRREKERFSNVLSDMLGKTHVNISCSGVSNDWIVKNTIEWFERGNSCDIAIIQFSQERRWMWYDKQGKQYHMPAKWIERKGTYSYTNSEKGKAQKAYMTHVISDHIAYDNYWKNMFIIRNYLKDKCKVIHLSLMEAPRGLPNFWYEAVGNIDILELKPLLKSRDDVRRQKSVLKPEFHNWIMSDNKYGKWENSNYCANLDDSDILDNNMNKRFSGAHPSAIGHQKIADTIMERLK